jgi:hypothetical protein
VMVMVMVMTTTMVPSLTFAVHAMQRRLFLAPLSTQHVQWHASTATLWWEVEQSRQTHSTTDELAPRSECGWSSVNATTRLSGDG